MVTLYDDQFNGLWRHNYSGSTQIDQFRSSPFLADVNYDGVNEIVECMQNSGTIIVWSLTGQEIAQITLPTRITGGVFATDSGIEGTPCTFINNGLLYIIIPCKDGTIGCWQFNQNTG
jgi:hypothetical protein